MQIGDTVRPSEIRAKEGFAALLSQLTGNGGDWQDGEDPPDFWLDWAGERFAIEVTEVMQRIPLGNGSPTERGVLKALKRAVAQLEIEILAEGILDGTYVMNACPIPDLRSQMPGLKADICEYIASTKHVPSAPSKQLLKGRRGQTWAISKVRPTGTDLLAGFSVGSVKMAIEASADLRDLIAERIEVKSTDYQNIPGKKVLLFVDSYLYADWEDWMDAAAVAAMSLFHTVAVISSVFGCRVLCSENKVWTVVT
jgi:hypothetical protein